jgi:hypothetical protein
LTGRDVNSDVPAAKSAMEFTRSLNIWLANKFAALHANFSVSAFPISAFSFIAPPLPLEKVPV